MKSQHSQVYAMGIYAHQILTGASAPMHWTHINGAIDTVLATVGVGPVCGTDSQLFSRIMHAAKLYALTKNLPNPMPLVGVDSRGYWVVAPKPKETGRAALLAVKYSRTRLELMDEQVASEAALHVGHVQLPLISAQVHTSFMLLDSVVVPTVAAAVAAM